MQTFNRMYAALKMCRKNNTNGTQDLRMIRNQPFAAYHDQELLHLDLQYDWQSFQHCYLQHTFVHDRHDNFLYIEIQ